jgi:hypothetical protein
MIRTFVEFVLGNFTLTFFVVGLLFSAVAIARAPKPAGRAAVIEKLMSWFVFWTIGVLYLYNAIFHIFFGQLAAHFIGWEDSPFQFEVGTSSLGFAAVGFLAAFGSFDLRLAAIIGSGIFMLGAAGGHVYQMITVHNFAPGNAGIIFWSDILLPLIALHRRGRVDLLELDGGELAAVAAGQAQGWAGEAAGSCAGRVALNRHTDENGAVVFLHACKMGLEGMCRSG